MQKNNLFRTQSTDILFGVTAVLLFKDIWLRIGDKILLNFTGKSLLARSSMIQFCYLLLSMILFAFVWRFLNSMISPKGKHIGSLLFLLLSFLCLLYLCSQQIIRRDDYWEIADARGMGIWGYVAYEFREFCGRYFSLFLKGAYSIFPPLIYINTLLGVNLVALYFGCVESIRALLPNNSISRFEITIVGSAAMIGIILVSPNMWEVWFWGGGTFIYGVGITLAIWIFAILARNITHTLCSSEKFILLCLVFLGCGCSELITATICLMAFGFVFFTPKRNRKIAIITMIFSWMCTIGILAFSGDIRDFASGHGNFSADPFSVVTLIPSAFYQALRTLAEFIAARAEYFVLFGLIFFILGNTYLVIIPLSKRSLLFNGCVIFLSAAVMTINTLLSYTPPRVISVPLSWLFLVWLGDMFLLGGVFQKRISAMGHGGVHLVICAILFMFLGNVFLKYGGNVEIIRDLWLERNTQLLALRGQSGTIRTCSIPVMGSSSLDLSDDPGADENLITAKYYGFDSIVSYSPCVMGKENVDKR